MYCQLLPILCNIPILLTDTKAREHHHLLQFDQLYSNAGAAYAL